MTFLRTVIMHFVWRDFSVHMHWYARTLWREKVEGKGIQIVEGPDNIYRAVHKQNSESNKRCCVKCKVKLWHKNCKSRSTTYKQHQKWYACPDLHLLHIHPMAFFWFIRKDVLHDCYTIQCSRMTDASVSTL